VRVCIVHARLRIYTYNDNPSLKYIVRTIFYPYRCFISLCSLKKFHQRSLVFFSLDTIIFAHQCIIFESINEDNYTCIHSFTNSKSFIKIVSTAIIPFRSYISLNLKKFCILEIQIQRQVSF